MADFLLLVAHAVHVLHLMYAHASVSHCLFLPHAHSPLWSIMPQCDYWGPYRTLL